MDQDTTDSRISAAALREAKPRVTKRRQALDHLYTQIHSGQMKPGDLMPTECELSESLGMSRNTVRQALETLVQEGIIHRIPGRGTFLTTDQQRKSREQFDVFALIAPQLREGFYPSLVHGFEQASTGCEHQTVIGNSGNDVGRQADLVLQMIDRCVGGVAIVPVTTATTPVYQIRQLQKHQIPVVFCHRRVEGLSAPCVTWSGQEVGLQVGQQLYDLGHRHVACMIDHITSLAQDYERGMRRAVEGEADCDVSIVEYGAGLSGALTADAIKKALTELMARPNRPTAIFCGNLPDAEQIYLQAQSFGLEVPKDLSLIYFGGTWRDHGLAQRISCIAVNEHEVGARAAELLHEMRSGLRPLDNNERMEFPVTMLPGETVGPAPAFIQP
jgi:GntR family transcriptional regulator, arabinose operon transcriptional repressor